MAMRARGVHATVPSHVKARINLIAEHASLHPRTLTDDGPQKVEGPIAVAAEAAARQNMLVYVTSGYISKESYTKIEDPEQANPSKLEPHSRCDSMLAKRVNEGAVTRREYEKY